MNNFDCVVVGGGMVGAASALSLAQLGLKVGVVEKFSPKEFTPEQPVDLRVSAISLASQFLLEQLDAWSQIVSWRACRYQRLAVWEHEFAKTEFNAAEINQEYLGHIVENRLIQLSLWQQLDEHENVTVLCPETVLGFEQQPQTISIQLENQRITSKLLIGADGANSQVRAMAGIGVTGWDYGQSAMLINVETELAQQNITWQKYTETGPMALLPLSGTSALGGYASLVWYHQRDEIKRLSLLSNEQLQQQIRTHFPTRLGNIRVLDKGSFSLTRQHANTYQQQRVLLLGDAAHTINPMAGQGVNLGFKDVKALQTLVANAIAQGKCWHDPMVLASYQKMRRADNLMMMSAMDALYLSFSHPSKVLKLVRNVGLLAANKTVWLKSKALAYACGI